MPQAVKGLCECGCGQRTRLAPRSYTKYGWVKDEPIRFIHGHQWRGRRHTEARNTKMRGPLHPRWKGDDVGYAGLHHWIRNRKPKTGKCEDCGRKGYTEFHNISGEYRRDVNDFIELCSSCHTKANNAQG